MAFRKSALAYTLLTLICVGNTSAQKAGRETSGPDNKPAVLVETLSVESKALNERREARIFVPESYPTSTRRYPVIYTLDGEGTGPVTANAVQFMTGFSSIPQMPDAIVVAISNSDRNRDMPVPTEYGKGREEKFLAFIADELIPAVEKRYRTEPLRVLVGHSQGGLFANYAMTARPSMFQWYLLIDEPMSGFPEIKSILEKTKAVIANTPNYRGRIVSVENLYGWKRDWLALIKDAPRGFYGEQVEMKDETHETMVYKGIYEGLKRLFHDYAPNIVKDAKGIYTLPVLDQMYADLSKEYGYRVDIPRQLLLMTASQNTAMHYGAEAVELVQRAVTLYGESPRTRQLLAEAEESAKTGRDPRFAEWASLPAPDAGRMKPFLGSWQLTLDRAIEVVTFAEKNGVVSTSYTVNPNGGEQFSMDVQFVRVLPDNTLEWGLHNGRGAGIILRTVRLVDRNTLEGTTEPVGIEHAPPKQTVTYKRLS